MLRLAILLLLAFVILLVLALSVQAATIPVQSDGLRIGTYLTGSLVGSIDTSAQQLSGTWLATDGALVGEFAGAVVSSNLTGFDGVNVFGFDSVRLTATDGAVILIGPGSSHPATGMICGPNCWNFWQDSARLPNGAFAVTGGDWRVYPAVPEPSSIGLVGFGLLAFGWCRWRQR